MILKYSIPSIEINQFFEVSILRKKALINPQTGETYNLSPEQAHWRISISPHEDLDLVKELSEDGAKLDEGFLGVIKNCIEPAIKTLWQPEVVQQYQVHQQKKSGNLEEYSNQI